MKKTTLRTASNEPIHVHAKHGDSVVKVSFFLKEGKIYRTTFAEINGKFPPQKMKQLKKLKNEDSYN